MGYVIAAYFAVVVTLLIYSARLNAQRRALEEQTRKLARER